MNTEQPKLNPKAQAVFDSIHATVRMCRYIIAVLGGEK